MYKYKDKVTKEATLLNKAQKDGLDKMVVRTNHSWRAKPANMSSKVCSSNLLQASLTLELGCISVGVASNVP